MSGNHINSVTPSGAGHITTGLLMKYFNHRQNPLKDTVSTEQMNDLFKVLVVTFGQKWLEKSNGKHVLQELWRRSDALSTSELFTLATSVKNLNSIDSSWVSHQVKQILSNDINNQKGAFFELIGLNLLVTPETKVKPAKKNQRGIDGIINFKDDGKINLSLKNYGLSCHHESFLSESDNFRVLLEKILNEKRINKIQIFIDSPIKYPNSADWAKIKSEFPNILHQFRGTFIQQKVGETWHITLTDIADLNNAHPNFSSYTIVLTSCYHDNEKNNLITKLNGAASNLSNSKVIETRDSCNLMFFHLPLTIYPKSCVRWAQEYFNDFSDEAISGALFYQTAVVCDTNKNTSFISHFLGPVVSKKFIEWKKNHPKNIIGITPPCGVPTIEPSLCVLTNGKDIKTIIPERYIFQYGKHFVKAKPFNRGFEGNIEHLGPGLQQYSVIDIKGKTQIIGGNFGDELLIL